MLNALTLFRQNIEEAKVLTSFYEYLDNTLTTSPYSFDDVLRAQIVYSVSAFDKLIHDLIRMGMVKIFVGQREATPKYQAEPITMELHSQLIAATVPLQAELFEQAIARKLKAVSYQEPSKVADGLSYIWDEKQKWQKIATQMGIDDKTAKTTLKLIVDRRNTIVHEVDINPTTNRKYAITQSDCQSITDFLEKCGESICDLVI